MLRFKQFVKENFIIEAKMSHFSHLGLDPENPEHKDLVDAYNAGVNRDPNVPKNPNQIKTFDQLKNTVAPHYADIQQKRQEDAEDKEAFKNKEAELVHHDPETGVKVFKVRSGKGCAAVGGDTKWCVADRKTGDTAFSDYDPKRRHSYVIHTPEKGNLSKIGIIGVKPGEEGETYDKANFQDKGNNTVSDENWEMLKKKYNLNNVKAFHGIRGLKNKEVEKEHKNIDSLIKNPNTTAEQLYRASEFSNNPEIHKTMINHPNVDDDSLSTIADKSEDPEVHKTLLNHEKTGARTLKGIAYKSEDPEIHKAIINHPKVDSNALSIVANKSEDPEIHKALINHKKSGKGVLNWIAIKSDDPEIHRKIVNHKDADDEILTGVSYKSKDPEIHKAIMNHKEAGDDALSGVAHKSNDPEIHKILVNHKRAGQYTLQMLVNKSNDPEIHKAIMNHKEAGDDTKKVAQKKLNSLQSDNPYQLESFSYRKY